MQTDDVLARVRHLTTSVAELTRRVNVLTGRSPAASKNEMATAIEGAGVNESADSLNDRPVSKHAATVPTWKAVCVIVESTCAPFTHDRWCAVLSPSRKYWWGEGRWMERNIGKGIHGEVYIGTKRASDALAACTTCPPDWPTPAHTDDPREQSEPFDPMTGPMDDGQDQSGLFRTVVNLPRVDLYVDDMRVDAVYVKAVKNESEHFDVKRAYWPMSLTSLMLARIEADLRRADYTPAQARNIVEVIKHGVAEFPYAALDPNMLEAISDQLLDQRGRGEEERRGE